MSNLSIGVLSLSAKMLPAFTTRELLHRSQSGRPADIQEGKMVSSRAYWGDLSIPVVE